MTDLPTKLPDGLPVFEERLERSHGPNPTTPGAHNHLGGGQRLPSTIEGLAIEGGHGHLPVEQQLGEHLYKIARAGDPEALRSLYARLLALPLDHQAIKEKLRARLSLAFYDNGHGLQRLWPDDVISKFLAQV
jgi:hypothetical protein